jgi:phosphoglycolate phosphatase-like HAD superfamily hydrolase
MVDTPYRSGIITSNSRQWLDQCIKAFDFPMWGVEYIACDAAKPDRKSGLDFLIRTNARPQDVHYVGDNPLDETYAKACGFKYHHYSSVLK